MKQGKQENKTKQHKKTPKQTKPYALYSIIE